ncbi:MAG: Holliday junction DNA helicase RuvA [Desulfobacterales bacterium]|nr:Holliday junction DNA helicase RuvA [Desulfobacterales bacterium]
MIGYIEGKLLKKESERILLLANGIGYEILLPAVVMGTLASREIGDAVSLYIYYQQSERQPKPVLIGFNLEAEKEFFQFFISVSDIGPLKAVKALSVPIRDIARAIEDKDAGSLKRLKGIGNRTAQKIIATLSGRMGKFALIRKDEAPGEIGIADFQNQVILVLVKQLGHKSSEAKQLVAAAMKRNSAISSAEELFDEVYKAEQQNG